MTAEAVASGFGSGVTFFEHPDPLVWWQLVLFYIAIAWAAFIIGAFGVGGGAIMAPGMLLLPGVTPAVAVPTTFVGTASMSLLRNIQLYRLGHLDYSTAWPLMVGSLVGALLGQVLLPYISSAALAFGVAAVAIFGGVKTQQKVLADRRAKMAAAAKQSEAMPPSTVGNHAGFSDDGDDGASPAVDAAGSTEEKEAANWPVPEEHVNARAHASGCAEGLMCMSLPCTGHILDGSTAAVKPVGSAGSSKDAVGPKTSASSMTAEAGGYVDKADEEIQAPESEVVAAGAENNSSEVCSAKLKGTIGMVVFGFFAALFSSLSGTGGPLILFPILLVWDPKVSMKKLVGLSNPFALVMVTTSGVTGLLVGEVDLGIASGMAVTSTIFILIGGCCMEQMNDGFLKLTVGVTLVILGLVVAIRTLISVI